MELTDSLHLSFLPVFNFYFGLWRGSVLVCEVILCHPPALTVMEMTGMDVGSCHGQVSE